MLIKADLPEKLNFLFRPARYKIARGGRGSAKSWSFARVLLILGAQKTLRILCAREVQLSIKQSVHRLLKDQIELLDLGAFYKVFDDKIIGRNGADFAFTGLSSLTVDTIKSFEGVDICWIEEGQAISRRSWDILIPTIRKEGSEIWVSYNPELESDETHQRFTLSRPPGTINAEINWRDNPWFSHTLEQERLYCKVHNPDDYAHIWEGKCKPAVEGAIYYKQVMEAETQGRITMVPYDPLLKVHLVFDLGWGDSLGCALTQVLASSVRIIEYMEANHTDWDAYSTELRTRPYNWGRVWLPHDGFSARLESKGKSSYDILKGLGWDCATRDEITELGVEEGIRTTRLVFPRIYFDLQKTAAIKPIPKRTDKFNATELNGRLLESIKRYRRSINAKTEAEGNPVRNPYAHGADVLRYISLNCDNMQNEDRVKISDDILAKAGLGQIWNDNSLTWMQS